MANMRDTYIAMLNQSIDYILEDIEEPKLFEMVSIIAKLAEQSAYTRREKKLQNEAQAEHERYMNINTLRQRVQPPMEMREQLRGVGEPRHA